MLVENVMYLQRCCLSQLQSHHFSLSWDIMINIDKDCARLTQHHSTKVNNIPAYTIIMHIFSIESCDSCSSDELSLYFICHKVFKRCEGVCQKLLKIY